MIKQNILICGDCFDPYGHMWAYYGKLFEKKLQDSMDVTRIDYETINGEYPKTFTKTTATGFLKKLWNIRKLIRHFNDGGYDKILIIEENFTALYYVIALKLSSSIWKKEIIIYHNDFIGINTREQLHFTSRMYYTFTKLLEKILLCNADKIIHKGHPDELKMLPYYDKIKDKPEYLMREYIDKDKIQPYIPKNRLSSIFGGTHVVYVGSVGFEKNGFDLDIYTMYTNLKKIGCDLHVYSTKDDPEINERCELIQKLNDGFHYHGNVTHDILMKELPMYDFGSYLSTGYSDFVDNHPLVKTAIGNKMFDYLMARLPLLYHDDMDAVKKYNNQFNVGIPVNKNDYNHIKDLLQDDNVYIILQSNIQKALDVLGNDERLIKFIRE